MQMEDINHSLYIRLSVLGLFQAFLRKRWTDELNKHLKNSQEYDYSNGKKKKLEGHGSD